jgi:hypothetical protein
MLMIIGTGFTMAGKLQVTAEPWIAGKGVIWLLAAGSMVLANRFSRFAPWIVVFFIGLVATAAYLAIYRP